jgi:hypothetical protein
VIIPEYNLIEYYLDFVPLTIRFCPQGVPSGKNREDMLSEDMLRAKLITPKEIRIQKAMLIFMKCNLFHVNKIIF